LRAGLPVAAGERCSDRGLRFVSVLVPARPFLSRGKHMVTPAEPLVRCGWYTFRRHLSMSMSWVPVACFWRIEVCSERSKALGHSLGPGAPSWATEGVASEH